MSRTFLVATVAALGLSLVNGLAIADPDKDRDRCGERNRWGERIMQKLDTDRDGRITRQEFDAAREARLKDRFARMDTDKDGKVTLEEFQKSRGGFGDRFFERFDHNKDGVVDGEELAAPKSARHWHDRHFRDSQREAERDS